MNTEAQPERFVVLAALDGDLSDRVALVAARFAASIAGGELHLMHVAPLPPSSAVDTTAVLSEGRAQLEKVGESVKEIHAGKIMGHLGLGEPRHEILQMAAGIQADLILVGTHGRKGLNRLLLGSVAEQIVRRASCPVLVVREKDYHTGLAPEIEPPCPDCLAVQASSKGEKVWCARHTRRHPHGHTYYEIPEPFALGSSLIRP